MASDDLRARIAGIRADAERNVHPSWRDINPTWVLLNELDRLTAEVDAVARRGAAAIAAMGADVRAARAERDRYRLAWQSARERAQAHGEGILRLCDDRDAYKGWMVEQGERANRAEQELAAVRVTLAKRDKRIEEYRASRKRWMEAAYADRGDAVRAAAERDGLRVELDELLDRLDDDTVGPDQAVAALLDQLAELLPDADPAEDMEHYLRQARVGHHRALRARDRRLAAEAQLAEMRVELDRLQALNDDAWGSVWLHGKWSWLTKCMTTEEREHAADCVARWSARLAEIDGDPDRGEPEGLRWWREPQPAPSAGLRGLLEHVGIDVAGRVITVDGVPIDDVGSAPMARGPYPKPAHGATVASDRCPSCGGDNTEPWALCPQCQTTTKE